MTTTWPFHSRGRVSNRGGWSCRCSCSISGFHCLGCFWCRPQSSFGVVNLHDKGVPIPSHTDLPSPANLNLSHTFSLSSTTWHFAIYHLKFFSKDSRCSLSNYKGSSLRIGLEIQNKKPILKCWGLDKNKSLLDQQFIAFYLWAGEDSVAFIPFSQPCKPIPFIWNTCPHCQPPHDSCLYISQVSAQRPFPAKPSHVSQAKVIPELFNKYLLHEWVVSILQMRTLRLTVIKNYLPMVKELLKGTNWGLLMLECRNAYISSVLWCSLAIVISYSIFIYPVLCKLHEDRVCICPVHCV